MTDPAEVKRVVDGFATKRLGLAPTVSEPAMKQVHEIMKAEHSKLRTTVYYLPAQETGTLVKI